MGLLGLVGTTGIGSITGDADRLASGAGNRSQSKAGTLSCRSLQAGTRVVEASEHRPVVTHAQTAI